METLKFKYDWRWLWPATQGLRHRIAANTLLGIIRVATSILFVWISKRLIDIATGHATGSIGGYALILGGIMVFELLSSVLSDRISSLNTVMMKNRLRQQLFARIMESRWTGREQFHTGDTLNRLEEDVRVVSDALCNTLPSVAATLLQLVAAFIYLLELDARLSWVILFIMPVFLLVSRGYIKRMRRLTKDIRTTDSRVQAHVQEHLQHRTLIRSIEHLDQSTATLNQLQTDLQAQVMRRTDYTIFTRTVVQLGFAAGYAVAFLWGVFGIKNGAITFGMMTAFLQLVMQIQRPVVELGRQIPGFVHARTSIDRLSELIALPREEQGEAIRLDGAVGLNMNEVTFTYPDGDRPVIDRFTCDFEPGSLTALVGRTGSGKSTLIRLMLALLKADRGTITLYNASTHAAVSPMTRCNFIYVPQGNTLLSGTIRDNLLLGKPQATDEELKEVLHAAVADFVFDLPAGLETPCGELGAGLSEGQAQRIAIARGLLRPGGILLLDEPTSALDAETEDEFIAQITRRTKGKTLIIVTHRESITRLCQQVIRLND